MSSNLNQNIIFDLSYSSCHQQHTVALSFLPYAAGKQQLEVKMH